jgi:hypothetical protein
VSSMEESVNVWDGGYSSGGNYWSDYDGTDLYSGPYQNETGYDWIGDFPYLFDQNNRDRYPLTQPSVPETEEVLMAYRNLLGDYNDLLTNYATLNTTYHHLWSDYSRLQESYVRLIDLVYALTAIIVILVVAIVYLAVIKPRTRIVA